jgi:hypothetical protein
MIEFAECARRANGDRDWQGRGDEMATMRAAGAAEVLALPLTATAGAGAAAVESAALECDPIGRAAPRIGAPIGLRFERAVRGFEDFRERHRRGTRPWGTRHTLALGGDSERTPAVNGQPAARQGAQHNI